MEGLIKSPQNKATRFNQPDTGYQENSETDEKKQSILGQIEKQTLLKKAVIWKEILSPPVSLKDSDLLF